MAEESRLAKNVGSNLAGYLVNVAVAFVLSPYVVHTLGDQSFGLWTLIVSLTGYYGILDFGVRSAVGQYATRYWAQSDMDGLNRTMSTALLMTIVPAVLIVMATLVVTWKTGDWFDVDPSDLPSMRGSMLVIGVGTALGFPLALFGVATYARQRFDIANAIGIPIRLLFGGLAFLALSRGYGLMGLAVVTTGVNLLNGLVRLGVAYALLPGLSLSPRNSSRGSVKELWNFGIWNFLVNVADRVVTHTDAIVIGAFLSTGAITYYAVGANLIPYYIALINAAAWTLTPYATSHDARGDREALRQLWVGSTRWILLMASVIGGGLVFLGHDFLSLWMGPKFVSGDDYPSSAVILTILAVGALVRLGMTGGKQVCFGMREVKFLGLLSLGEAIGNILLSVLLVGFLGSVGVAVATLISVLIAYLWIQPRFLLRRLEMRPAQLWSRALPSTLTVFGIMGLLNAALQNWLPAQTWPGFLVKAFLIATPALAAGLTVGINPKEREWLRNRLCGLIPIGSKSGR